MKTIIHRVASITGSLLLGIAGMASASNLGNASAVNMKIYALYLSPNEDCSSPVQLFSNPSPVAQNMLASPDLGSGAVPNGTYRCVIVKMSDQVTATSAYTSDTGHCVAGGALPAQDVCRGGQTSTALDGSTINCTAGDDTVYAYFSTATGGDHNCLQRGGKCSLAAPFTVTPGRVGTFVADFDGQIQDAYGECGIQPPVFSFR